MKTSKEISKSIVVLALLTALVLAVPLVAMQFTEEVNWSVGDFLVMGILIFSSGLSYVLITRYVTNAVYKVAIIVALGSTFLMMWVNLAVGLIGSGPHLGNLMYLGVMAVGLVSAILSRFTPAGMERTMFAMAFALAVLVSIALSTNMQQYPGSSVTLIVGINSFFAILFVSAGLLFRYVALKQSKLLEK